MLDHLSARSSNQPGALLSDIRNANDAHRIFEAVRLGILPLITRRLTPTERDLLRSGQVFVWEEGSSSGGGAEDGTPSAGLERWTDGRRWYIHSTFLSRFPLVFLVAATNSQPFKVPVAYARAIPLL